MSEHTKGRADTIETGRKQPPTEREALRAELSAARALLREVLDFEVIDKAFAARITAYLDACDTPGEQNAS